MFRFRGKMRATWSILIGAIILASGVKQGIIEQNYHLGRRSGRVLGGTAVFYGVLFSVLGGFFIYRGFKELKEN